MAIRSIPAYPMPALTELPLNTATWIPDPARAVLLVHDMQRYFLRPFAEQEEPGRALVTNAAALLRGCRARDVPVAYTAQPGDMTARERGLLRDFWGPGMSGRAEHRQVIDELAPDERSTVFTKWRYSAFQRSGLLAHLRALGRDQLIICGVYVSIGCLSTAVDGFAHDIETFLVADAVADFSADQHRMALQYAAARCAVVLPCAEVLDHLARPALAGHRNLP